MQRFIAVAISAGFSQLLPACVVEGAEPGRVEALDGFSHENSDTTFPELSAAVPRDFPRAGERPARTDDVELLATIVGARISEPERVTRVLNELRLESTGHLGRLDVEEWSEMMAEMRSGGVALGSRNKLRLLVAEKSTAVGASSVGSRRAQADESSSRTERQDDSTSTATKQAREQESTNKSEGTVFGVSGDSAPHVPLRCLV
jgi:hypothetical protein